MIGCSMHIVSSPGFPATSEGFPSLRLCLGCLAPMFKLRDIRFERKGQGAKKERPNFGSILHPVMGTTRDYCRYSKAP